MPRIVDNLIAYKVLKMLVTPFTETPAFKLGIIDERGNNLIKTSKLTTAEQKDAYTYLTRLVFNMKKILMKLPGGDKRVKNLIAALWLVRESYENKKTAPLTEDVTKLVKLLDTITLVEEEITVKNFLESKLEEDGIGGGGVAAPAGIANITGSGVSTDQPAPSKADVAKYKKKNGGVISFARRNKVIA